MHVPKNIKPIVKIYVLIKSHWLRQFNWVDAKITLNEDLGVLPTGISHWMYYILKSVKVSGFTHKHGDAKLLPTW